MRIRIFYFVVCLALLKGALMFSQEYKKFHDLIMDLHHGETDVVFMQGKRYLTNKSFLFNIDGYKNLYPEITKIEVDASTGEASFDYDMNYTPFWLIRNDSIYLIGLSLNSDYCTMIKIPLANTSQLPAERFLRMAKFVNKRFEKGDIPEACYKQMRPEWSMGIMFASWINGVFYIKQAREPSQELSDWLRTPIWKLTVKDGKILKTEKV